MKSIVTLAFLCAISANLIGCANSVFYQPNDVIYRTPANDGYAYEEVEFASGDGTKLSGWFIAAQGKAHGTVIHFHGNAQNMTAHYSFVSWLPKRGFNLFVFDYRGYGRSQGKPNRKGVYEDSVAAIKYVQSRSDVEQDKILIFGQSLGGANAIAAVGRNEFIGIKGVAIDSAFYSYELIAKHHLAKRSLGSTTGLLVTNDYSPGPVVDQISPIPLLLIHGTSDQVIPFAHSKMLYDKANEPKELWFVPKAQHTEALTRFGRKYIPRLERYFLECLGEG